jgi:hypothetical protein
MPAVTTKGLVAAMSDDAVHGFVNPPGLHLMSVKRSGAMKELEPLQGASGIEGRAWINDASKMSISAVILEGFEMPKQGDSITMKERIGDTAAKLFIVDSVGDGGKWGERIVVDIEMTWDKVLADLEAAP